VRVPSSGGGGGDRDDQLIDWLVTEYTPTDAYCLVSTCPDFRINVYQMCRVAKLSYVTGAELPRKYLLR
jgi:hypothetical protein